MSNPTTSRLDRVSFVLLQIILFITPVLFIPSLAVPFQTGKTALILYGIIAAFIVWAIARLKDGMFEVPKSLFYASLGIFGIAYVVSALLSGNTAVSFAGMSFDFGTLSFMLPSLVLFGLIPLVVRSEKDIVRSYATLLATFLLISIFHIVRLVFGADVLDFGMFGSATSNLIGKWNDLGIFFGLSVIVSFITLDRLHVRGVPRALVYAALILSLVMLAVINFGPVWIMLAVLSFVLVVHKMSFEKHSTASRVPYHALVVLVVSLLFVFIGGKVSGLVAESLNTAQIEVRPSWQATFDITKTALADNPVWGIGPNRFSAEWLAHKPAEINNTIFWNVNFNYGIGFIPSLAVSTGVVGILSALLAIVLFAMLAVKALFKAGASSLSRYLVLSSLFASLYLWVFAVIYVPSPTVWILTLAFSGLFIASLREDKILAVKSVSTIEKPAASFISVLFVILALIGTVAFAYFVTVKLMANVYYQKGIIAVNASGDLDKGERYIAKALAMSPSDAYYQSLAQIYLIRLNNLFQDTKVSQAEAQQKFQSLLSNAIGSAQAAVDLDPTNYMNHVALGRVFESVVPLNITGAYDSAKKAYESALAVNPQSPEMYLMLARLEVAKKDTKAAKEHINKALEKKGDYADAIFLLSQIQIAENDVYNAIKSVGAVAMLNPQDPGLFFQLGILYYSVKDYQNSTMALERAVALSPEYANARYFLGLSYYQLKDTAKAIAQFKEIQKTNSGNEEIQIIISNLEAGKPPFNEPTNPVSRPALPLQN